MTEDLRVVTKPRLSRFRPLLPTEQELAGRKMRLEIQGKTAQNPPKNCLGHYTSISKWCLGCEHDKDCRLMLSRAYRITIAVRSPELGTEKREEKAFRIV